MIGSGVSGLPPSWKIVSRIVPGCEVVGAHLVDLRALLRGRRLLQVERGELAQRVGVLRSQRDVALERLDRAVGVAGCLLRRREIPERLGVLRVVEHALLGVGDGRRAASTCRVADDVAEADATGADAEADEPEREDEREEEEHPLRMPAKPREEHGVLDYDVGSACCSSRPRALRAASISSSHVFPPFSYRGLPDTSVATTP